MDIHTVDRDALVMELILTAKSGRVDQYEIVKAELERRDRELFEGTQGN